jgi:hypothetical protein
MHDPMKVAHEIRYPWKKWGPRRPSPFRDSEFSRTYRESFITIWHVDPEKRGSDDSCDWFNKNRYRKAFGTDFNRRINELPEPSRELFSLLENIVGWKRSWYRHPRWHFWHWELQIHPAQQLKRWLFSRCAGCGKHFAYGESPVTHSWNSTGPRWFRSESNSYHQGCAAVKATPLP